MAHFKRIWKAAVPRSTKRKKFKEYVPRKKRHSKGSPDKAPIVGKSPTVIKGMPKETCSRGRQSSKGGRNVNTKLTSCVAMTKLVKFLRTNQEIEGGLE